MCWNAQPFKGAAKWKASSRGGTSVWRHIHCGAGSLPAVPSSPPVLTFMPHGVSVSAFSKWNSIFMSIWDLWLQGGAQSELYQFQSEGKTWSQTAPRIVWLSHTFLILRSLKWMGDKAESLKFYFSLSGKGLGSTTSLPSSPCSSRPQSGVWFLTRSSESSHRGVHRLSSISPNN